MKLLRESLPPEWRSRLRQFGGGGICRPGSSYSNAGEQVIIARLLSGANAPRFCVDIGASDGRTMSNALALFEQGWGGLSIEMDGDAFRALAVRHSKYSASSLFRGRVTPDNIVELLRAAGTPVDCGFVSIDIDGYDYFVLEELLNAYRPALICAEINEKIPPPLRFTVLYSPDYSWDGSHFYGQSISQLALLCERYDYCLVALEYNNAFLMPTDLAQISLDAESAYRTGYSERADRLTRFPWNANMENRQTLPSAAAADLIRTTFSSYDGKFLLDR